MHRRLEETNNGSQLGTLCPAQVRRNADPGNDNPACWAGSCIQQSGLGWRGAVTSGHHHGNTREVGRKGVAGHSNEGHKPPGARPHRQVDNKQVAVVARNTQAPARHKQGQVLHTPEQGPHTQGRKPLLRQPRRRRLRRSLPLHPSLDRRHGLQPGLQGRGHLTTRQPWGCDES